MMDSALRSLSFDAQPRVALPRLSFAGADYISRQTFEPLRSLVDQLDDTPGFFAQFAGDDENPIPEELPIVKLTQYRTTGEGAQAEFNLPMVPQAAYVIQTNGLNSTTQPKEVLLFLNLALELLAAYSDTPETMYTERDYQPMSTTDGEVVQAAQQAVNLLTASDDVSFYPYYEVECPASDSYSLTV